MLRGLVQVICFIKVEIQRRNMQYFPDSPPHFPVILKLRPVTYLEMWYKRDQGVVGISLMISHHVIIIADSFYSNGGT